MSTTNDHVRDCAACGWPLGDDCFTDAEATVCRICEDPANHDTETHTIRLSVVYRMEEMDGTPEQSAEIALAQISEALNGRESEYGWPQPDGVCDVRVEVSYV